MVRLLDSIIAATSLIVFASADGTTCGEGKLCPENLPCCSQYGQCGIGAYCLGGCDPLFSHSLDSCMPAPVCNSQDYKFTSLDGFTSNQEYLGDASKTTWVYSGEPKQFKDGDDDVVLLTMPKDSVGTLLASTAYVWYGKISATMKTSRGAGVVTAFILLSDVKDEIDFEFVGVDLNDAQSNYYFQGIDDYTHGANMSLSSDSFSTWHTYEIDWNPTSVTWSIDGKSLRTLERDKTWNATKNRYDFPQTPARVQLSLWPAGLPSNGQGTIEWAGGLIDWNSPDVQHAGYYYAMVKDVTVECYDPPSGANVSGKTSYIYSQDTGLNNTVATTDDNTVLKSFLGSGLNPDAGAKASGTASASGAAATTEAPTVPGLTGAGTGSNGQRGGGGSPDSGSGGGSASSPSGSTPAGSNPDQPSSTGFHGFMQGTNTGSNPKGEKVLQGSMLAVLLAIAGLLVL